MASWIEALKMASPKSYSETFSDQVHGWMSSRYDVPKQLPAVHLLIFNRADFNNLHNFEEYLRGYRIIRTFFSQHL